MDQRHRHPYSTPLNSAILTLISTILNRNLLREGIFRVCRTISPFFVAITLVAFLPFNVLGQNDVTINDLVIRGGTSVNLGSSNSLSGKIASEGDLNAVSSTFIDGDIFVSGNVGQLKMRILKNLKWSIDHSDKVSKCNLE